MKLSDYVAEFIYRLNTKHAFVITGGASVHIIDSIAKHPDMTYICPNHEQSSAFAADAYSRINNNIGVAISTSGPGATNMITGICSSWFDSVPVLYITGQVSTFRLKKNLGVRQLGFQENDTLDMVKPITKYAVTITKPEDIRYELEKAMYLATSGRPGPVVLDIPDNIYRQDINEHKLLPFNKPIIDPKTQPPHLPNIANILSNAKQPVLIIGWGVKLANAEKDVEKLIKTLNIPVLLTWAMKGYLDENDELYAGTFGTHGSRYGNFAVQSADVLISIGSRLDTHETGSPVSDFAPNAVKIIVDIDENEINKFNELDFNVDYPICTDAKIFTQKVLEQLDPKPREKLSPWINKINGWKAQFPNGYITNPLGLINPYKLMSEMSYRSKENDIVVTDTGCTLAWLMQGFIAKKNQKFIHAYNNTPMGYALPASIGLSLASKQQITCLVGDGSLMMNIQELPLVVNHQMNIKIFLFNNSGYSMICQTQEQWLDNSYQASTTDSGLCFPDFEAVAKAHGFKYYGLSADKDIAEVISSVYAEPGPVFCNVNIDPKQRVVPQLKFGHKLEDMEPLLDKTVLLEIMKTI
ncbi:thiamine pyrophosphate-binding protein [Colwellia sp. UCD-KL20]|uniref:thiamine pyrophosphate-binding protein n=1 Tax=Colwellia sp. UCD-KL20 TaxID=1917165 RepID=UPI00097084A9|nr:thiamine pyrophosphate-binding protein [Colwellia sp. UCD-KL20]